MLARLIQFALTQRLLMLLVVLLLAGGGWVAFQKTPIDAFPDVSTTQVKIIIKAPGMTPEEVESRITAPVEVEMLGIPHMNMLRSITKYALTDITVDFEEGTNVYWARQQVAERLTGIWGDLPKDISGGIAPLTTPLGEMFMFSVDGGDLDLRQRRDLLDWVIRPALRTVPGVADVNALGGLVRTFEVVPDNARKCGWASDVMPVHEYFLPLSLRGHVFGRGYLCYLRPKMREAYHKAPMSVRRWLKLLPFGGAQDAQDAQDAK
jgi:cobalt-zinc-cadmium resistance protein CzcA